MPYGQDIWLPPIVVQTGVNDEVEIIEDPGGTPLSRVATIPAGTYYSVNEDFSGFLGLWKELTDQFAAITTTNTYTFEVITPTLSTAMTSAGLRLKAASATVDFVLNANRTNGLDIRNFGFRKLIGSAATNLILSVTSGSDEVVDSDFTMLNRWFSHTLLNDNAATDKRSTEARNVRFSSGRIEDAVAVRWDSPKNRRVIYEWLKSPHVYNRADDTDDDAWFNGSDLNVDDNLNAFIDVWSTMSDLGETVILHNVDPVDLLVTTHQWEAVKMRNEGQARNFDNVANLLRPEGEWYGLTVDLFVDPDADNYPH